MRRLCATVLGFEAIVVILAIPVAINIGHTSPRTALIAGGSLAGVAVLLSVVVARPRIVRPTLVAGSVLQACVIAAGVLAPAMYGLGVIFAVLWSTAIWLGYRHRAVSGR
jgi:hypothetical protein